MLVHCVTLAEGSVLSGFGTLCGEPALSSSSVSDDGSQITCEDCLLRLIARVHGDMATLLRQLGARVIELRAQQKAAQRD